MSDPGRMDGPAVISELTAMRQELARTRDVIGTLITWLAQSANAPIRAEEAGQLLGRLDAAARRLRLPKGRT